MRHKQNNIEIEVYINTYIRLIIFSFIITFIFLLNFIRLLAQAYRESSVDIVATLLSAIIFFIALQVFLWFSFGRERLEISADKLFFIRSNGLLSIRKSFLVSDIHQVILHPKTYPLNSFIDRKKQRIRETRKAMFCWYNMGSIAFKIKNHNSTFFNGMDNQQASKTVLFLAQLLEEKSTLLK
jgi:hypothetical protein